MVGPGGPRYGTRPHLAHTEKRRSENVEITMRRALAVSSSSSLDPFLISWRWLGMDVTTTENTPPSFSEMSSGVVTRQKGI